jgi:hypothetical protein
VFNLDLPGALVTLYTTLKRDKELMDWLRLILSCAFSGFVALTGTWGSLLVAGQGPWMAFGGGLCACAVAVLTVLLRMKQGRSLMVAAPSSVIVEYQKDNQTVVEPEGK